MQQPRANQLHLLPRDFFQYFPHGLKILYVGTDNDIGSLIQRNLVQPYYHVARFSSGPVALALLRDHKHGSYDLVLSDESLEHMDVYNFLRDQHSTTSIPHVVISGCERVSGMARAFRYGACYVLRKPVSECELRNLWQHVCRRRELPETTETDEYVNSDVDDEHHQQNNLVRHNRQRNQDQVSCNSSLVPCSIDNRLGPKAGNDSEFVDHGVLSQRKRRVVWTAELHEKFVGVVEQLGYDKAVPKQILESMDVPFLTRENVASHLQKYRINRKEREGEEMEELQRRLNQHGKAIPVNPDSIPAQPLSVVHQPVNPHLLEPSMNNPPHLLYPSVNLIPSQDLAFFSQAHQMQMQPPGQNFSFGLPSPASLARQLQQQQQIRIPSFFSFGGHMTQQQCLNPNPNLFHVLIPMEPQYVHQNLSSGGDMLQQQLNSNQLASGGDMLQQNLNSNVAPCSNSNGSNMLQQHLNSSLASNSNGGTMQQQQQQQVDQNLASGDDGMVKQEVATTLFGGNPDHPDQFDQGLSYTDGFFDEFEFYQYLKSPENKASASTLNDISSIPTHLCS
ncbi:two-component response regulator ARR14-like [Prosopis cineraria]|uniref:two-component response regulator ARR14-like n=1 Tax=Prosopis cineraria TaxID=364024 RepID=UPI00240F0846|nr:two-component response regulator ARR14-like [Prosopis cineraria]